MKKILRIVGAILIIQLIHSCCKEERPTLTTATVINITGNTALCGGTITDEGSGTVISRGVCWSTAITPTLADSKTVDGAGAGTFASNITGLNGATTYYVRAYATNKVGTGFGMTMSFTTLGQAPTASTESATNITTTSAKLNGKAKANYLSTTVTFEYGTTMSYGQTVSPEQNQITGNTFNNVSADIFGLTPGTIYHFRMKTMNSLGTVFGNDLTFTTVPSTLLDEDGNTYNVISIGIQVWMAENLKTTKYKDGTSIPNVIDNTTWNGLSTDAYCWYNNDDASFKATYGALYNWFAVNTAKLCPTGWHVPSDAEWTTLTTYLGGESVAGGKLKETGIAHWQSPNTGATDEIGFTALPGGYRGFNGTSVSIGGGGSWWSSSVYSTQDAWHRGLNYSSSNVSRSNGGDKRDGFSVRCLKDN
jgi:uncharacterized protein (TIGR02145 family)